MQGELRGIDPGLDGGLVVRQVGRLPLQVRQGGGEVDGLLAGAAANSGRGDATRGGCGGP